MQIEEVSSSQPRSCIVPAILVFVVIIIAYIYYLSLPIKHSEATVLEIASGTSVTGIANQLKEKDLIKSTELFRALYYIFHREEPMLAGYYSFNEDYSTLDILEILTQGESEFIYTPVTFPEGITVTEMAEIAGMALVNFDKATYIEQAESYEGKLFPDTYYLEASTSAEDLLALQRSLYQEKVSEYNEMIAEHSLSEDEIIILASIVEKEANDDTSMRMVAGILLNRLAIDMPLQADATIGYVTKHTDITAADLKIDSPYNSYLYRGLPPTAIGNPGLQTIKAVLDPMVSEYYYYITGNDGVFYYAKTLTEHNQNIAKYLR